MMPIILSTLVDVPVNVTFSNRESLPVRPGTWFELPIVLTPKGDSPLDWTHQNPIKLSYRWLDQEGNTIERDGRRTDIPSGALKAGGRLDLDLGGLAPEQAGLYELQVSLVLEGVHWACEVSSSGWVQRVVDVSPAPAWPEKLEQSRGGRALRGALVANELAWLLQKRPLARGDAKGEIEVESKNVRRPLNPEVHAPTTYFQRLRNRLRATLGISGLERQIEGVLSLASRQEEQSRDLEKQLAAFKEEVLAELAKLQTSAPKELENVSDARKKLRAKLLLRDIPTRPRAEGKLGATTRPGRKTGKTKNISGTLLP